MGLLGTVTTLEELRTGTSPRMNRDAIEGYFRIKGFPNMKDLITIVGRGVPVDVKCLGALYGNHASATSNDSQVTTIILVEVLLGRVFLYNSAT